MRIRESSVPGRAAREPNPLVDKVLSRQGPLPAGERQPVGQGRRRRDPDLRYIICNHPSRPTATVQRKDAIGPDREGAQGASEPKSRTAKRKAQTGHTQTECALRDHPRLVIDRAKITTSDRISAPKAPLRLRSPNAHLAASEVPRNSPPTLITGCGCAVRGR